MKTKYTSLVGILAMLVLIASFVVPAKLATPEPVSAQSPMEWLPVDTPDSEPGLLKALYTPVPVAGGAFTGVGPELGSELTKLLIGNDGTTMYTMVTRGDTGNVTSCLRILKSVDGGVTWSVAAYNNLDRFVAGSTRITRVWDIAIAPDDPAIIVAAIDTIGAGAMTAVPQQVWISTNGGTSWDNTNWDAAGGVAVGMYISCMDVSMDYGSARDILVGVRSGADSTNIIYTMKVPGYGGWNRQDAAGNPPSTNPFPGDVIDAKFSPTYIGDSTIVVLYATDGTVAPMAGRPGTYLITGAHDIVTNVTRWQDPATASVEIAPTAATSPDITLAGGGRNPIITGMIQMPSDYSGQSASLRRVYICTDAIGPAVSPGVFRVDDNVLYALMDNTATSAVIGVGSSRRAASIAYWGTYASGKLLVGERLGQQCTASVDTWFTDSPTTCPVPCWYPAKKPVSGAAGDVACTTDQQGYGNAYVVWSSTYAAQGVAYAVTGASSYDTGFALIGAGNPVSWPAGIYNVVSLDESAFALTRNNGETWNELSLIDTRMNKLTDVAPSADCTTVYLASVNNAAACKGFDSVWRSSVNEKVVAPPLPALPIGSIWERIRVSPTGPTCDNNQSEYAILRLAPDKEDGQVVGWAAGGANGRTFIHNNNAVGNGNFLTGANTQAMAWSPDFGDYWANITPRLAVQDFAFESSTILYVLEAGSGDVQKMPYTGTAWSSSMPSVSTQLGGGHTIEAKAPDKVLVGNQAIAITANVTSAAATPFPVAISTDGGVTFIPMVRTIPQGAQFGYHAIFDTDYGVGNNTTIYEGSDAAGAGLIHRNTAPSGANVSWTDMITGYTTHVEYYGLVQTNSQNVAGQGTLYAAHAGNVTTPGLVTAWSGVERTLSPLDGIPKPGIEWWCLDADGTYRPNNPQFILEPKSLKLCGCLTQDTNTTLYAIDDDVYGSNHNGVYNATYGFGAGVWLVPPLSGRLWSYEDCVAKKGPVLTMDDGTIIGCDPATGRAQEVNFTWEQLCIANTYQLVISKDSTFTLPVYDSGAVWVPADLTAPAAIYLSNESSSPFGFIPLECGHTYYWKVRVVDETTADAVVSPYSEIRSFTIKAGFRVTTPYYGPQLLMPDNGCGCACDAPICFSWSPFKETTEYMFELSENADMSSPLVSTTISTTAYQYTGTVECNKNYFWRVMAVQPAPSEWSAVFSFMTQAEPPAPEPEPEEPGVPIWAWTLIAIGAILIILVLVLVVKTRRRF